MKPFPIPKIQDLLLKLEALRYATSLHPTMGYYHITFCPISRTLCTIVLCRENLNIKNCQWDHVSSFQEKMNE